MPRTATAHYAPEFGRYGCEVHIVVQAGAVARHDVGAADAEPEKHVSRIIRYFNESNKPRRTKGFDVSFIGGPYYSSDTKFGIGLVAAALLSYWIVNPTPKLKVRIGCPSQSHSLCTSRAFT